MGISENKDDIYFELRVKPDISKIEQNLPQRSSAFFLFSGCRFPNECSRDRDLPWWLSGCPRQLVSPPSFLSLWV